MVDLAWRMLWHDKTRFMITVSGVAFAVALVFVQVGLFLGLLNNASVTIKHMDADLWITPHNTSNVDFANFFPETYIERVRSIPGVSRADNLIVFFMFMTLPSGSRESVEVYGMEDFRRWNFPWKVSEGNLDDLRRGNYIFMDQSATRRFGPFSTGEYRELMDRRVKIIGKTSDAVSFTTTPLVFMDYHRAQVLGGDTLEKRASYGLVKLSPGADVEQVRQEIMRRLPHNDVHTKAEWSRLSESYWVDNTGIGLNMYLTVFLGVLVGVVVVTQTLYTSTIEHIKEYGTVKAIGGRNRDLYFVIGKQALIAAVLGFAVGGAMAWSLRGGVERAGLKLLISPEMAVMVGSGAVVLCLAAALISIRKVAKLDPALVFRT